MTEGGYDDGYSSSKCFWGIQPASFVARFLDREGAAPRRVLDLGCGEGKNANAFALAGATVEAVDCSTLAIQNGKALFESDAIKWHIGDAARWPLPIDRYDVIVSYGLFHCLDTSETVAALIRRAKMATRPGGHHIICAFNDRSQDLVAHPGFEPLLLPHHWFLAQYGDWVLEQVSDSDLHETHPHNLIPHHHSLTRMIARKNV